MLSRMPPDTLSLLFARVDHTTLDLLLRTSRRFRKAARKQMALRCRLAHTVFDTLADERRVFQGRRNGRLVVTIDIRMDIRLVRDRLDIEVREERDLEGFLIVGSYSPARLDVLTVWPAEDRVDRNLNYDVKPAIPVPAQLVDYLRANFMRPAEDEMEIVCVTAGV